MWLPLAGEKQIESLPATIFYDSFMGIHMRKRIDLSGQRFSRLTVVEIIGRYKNGDGIWKCVCDCGKTVNVLSGNLKQKNTKSCGCFHSEISSNTYKSINYRHGMTNSKIWRTWKSMNDRCSTYSKDFANYLGRGIDVCERWKNFENFAADVSQPENENLSLDRIDNNQGYKPGNVRWATAKQQAANRRPRKQKINCYSAEQ